MEMVVFRQVQATRGRNTLRPVGCDWFFADPELGSPSPKSLYELGSERTSTYVLGPSYL